MGRSREEQDALKAESRLSEFLVIPANGDAYYISLKGDSLHAALRGLAVLMAAAGKHPSLGSRQARVAITRHHKP